MQLEVVEDAHGTMLVVGPGAVVAAHVAPDQLRAWAGELRGQMVWETDGDAAEALSALGAMAPVHQTADPLAWLEPSRRRAAVAALVPPGLLFVVAVAAQIWAGAEVWLAAFALSALAMLVRSWVGMQRLRHRAELARDRFTHRPDVELPRPVARRGAARSIPVAVRGAGAEPGNG